VEAGRVFGVLVPRVAPLTPLETGDLEGRRAAARGEVEAAAAAVATAQKALERLRTLNAANQAASDQAVEEAAGRLAGLRAQEQAARTTLETWEHLLATPLAPLAPVPLTVPMAGEVVEVMASPGEQVEAGAELLRVSDPAVLLARVLWPGEAAPGEPPREAQVAAAGDPAQQYAATVLGPAASSSPSLAGAWLLRIELPETAALRPGTRVVATLPLPGPAVEGFELPAAALLLHAGQTWCYVEVESGRFLRRALTLQRVRDSLLVTSGLDATDRVVTRGAALLLSQELLAAGGGEP